MRGLLGLLSQSSVLSNTCRNTSLQFFLMLTFWSCLGVTLQKNKLSLTAKNTYRFHNMLMTGKMQTGSISALDDAAGAVPRALAVPGGASTPPGANKV